MILPDLRERLLALPSSPERSAYLGFLETRGEDAVRRDGGPEHITASTFVLSPGLDQVLLCFHRKGQFWVQFGGHIEPGDATIAGAALREAREESGVRDLALASTAITDLDRHDLHGGFRCAAHWDVGFTAILDPSAAIAVSEESEAVRWFALDALPRAIPAALETRLAAAVRAASRSATAGSTTAGSAATGSAAPVRPPLPPDAPSRS